MKNYIYIVLLGSMFLGSCAKNNNPNATGPVEEVCTPYINFSVSSGDFPLIVTDINTSIIDHRQEGDCLVLNTRFSGGCEEHVLELYIDDGTESTINLSSSVFGILSHDNTDQCEALVAFDVYVDISGLEMLDLDTVELLIQNYEKTIELTF